MSNITLYNFINSLRKNRVYMGINIFGDKESIIELNKNLIGSCLIVDKDNKFYDIVLFAVIEKEHIDEEKTKLEILLNNYDQCLGSIIFINTEDFTIGHYYSMNLRNAEEPEEKWENVIPLEMLDTLPRPFRDSIDFIMKDVFEL